MADNVPITSGSGTNIATDDVSGVHFQKIKLYASTDGTEAPLSKAEDSAHADGDHGFLMLGVRNYSGASSDGDYSAVCVSSTGELCTLIRRDLKRIAVTSGGLTTATTNYSAGDQVGTVFTITDAARASGGSGIITGVQIISNTDNGGAYDVVFFDSAPAATAGDNAAWNLANDSDAQKIVGIVQCAAAFDTGANRIAQAFNIAIPYVCNGSANLTAALIKRDAVAFFYGATSDILLVVYVERN